MSRIAGILQNYFLARRLAQGRLSFPVNLRHNRVYVFPTRQGFVFFTLLLAILFGSLNHNNNLGLLLTFLLGGMAFVSIFHTYRNIAGLQLLSAKAYPVFAGQVAWFELSLKAPRYEQQALSLYFGSGEPVTVTTIPGDNKKIVTVPHPTRRRGLLAPDQLYVSTTYPLGLFRGWSVLFIDAVCVVYPEPIAGPMITAQGRKIDDSEGEPGGEGVDDFAELSGYQPGDALQHISWKAYSRGQGLYTKKFIGQAGKTIYFDPEILGSSDMEYKLSRVCYMILKAEEMQLTYGLKIGSRLIEPDHGGNHKRLCLNSLARLGQ
jgi:uncharacterized protein (DUF58 family)